MLEKISPIVFIDFYKADHRRQYPDGTEVVYSNFTPRMSRVPNVDSVVVFGLQYFIKEYLIDKFNKQFFELPKDVVLNAYKRRMDTSLGPNDIGIEHIEALHDLGYLPLSIKALPEGTLCNIKIPCYTFKNTKKEFFWLTNYIESIFSAVGWKPMTSATTAYYYRKRFNEHCYKTGYDNGFVQWQGHDFSFRGMSGLEDAVLSASGHLLSFTGTDTVPALDFLELFYGADADKELIGGSVPATEHSVCSSNIENYMDVIRKELIKTINLTENEIREEAEARFIKKLITELYPNGIVSIVSDTFDFWYVVTKIVPRFKNVIMSRDGRVVIRPDSGDPVKIICGDPDSNIEHIRKGAYECLWDTFGGKVNSKGYRELDGHIGLIYGDSITRDRQDQILDILEAKGFSASNLVLGIGSYTYEYVTRDTYGFAMKATYCEVNGESRNIFKNPKTDKGFKKSAKGLLCVNNDGTLSDECTLEEEQTGKLIEVFRDGKLLVETTLGEIRNNLWGN